MYTGRRDIILLQYLLKLQVRCYFQALGDIDLFSITYNYLVYFSPRLVLMYFSTSHMDQFSLVPLFLKETYPPQYLSVNDWPALPASCSHYKYWRATGSRCSFFKRTIRKHQFRQLPPKYVSTQC